MIKGDFSAKMEKIDKKRQSSKEKYQKILLAAEAARKQIEKFEREDGAKLKMETNKALIATILDIGFDYQDIILIIGSLLKTKAIMNGTDEKARMQLVNECIDLYNATAKEKQWELNGYKTAEDYSKVKVEIKTEKEPKEEE